MKKPSAIAAQPSLWTRKVPSCYRLYADMESYLLAQPASRERDALLLRVQTRLDPVTEAPPRKCKIRFKYTEGEVEKRYPYFNQFITDGDVCAGCGGYNDYGMSGTAGFLCYGCYRADEDDLTQHPWKRGGSHASEPPPPPHLAAEPVFSGKS